MKLLKTIFVIYFVLSINFAYSQIDSTAFKIVQKSLKTIQDYLHNKKSDTGNYRVRAIAFLTLLTGISSESDGNYLGQFSPTQKDYDRWAEWLHIYKKYLKWNSINNVIVIHNEVKVLQENIPKKGSD